MHDKHGQIIHEKFKANVIGKGTFLFYCVSQGQKIEKLPQMSVSLASQWTASLFQQLIFESFEPKKLSYFLFLTNAKQKILTSVCLLISFWTLIKFWLQRNLILNNFLYQGTNLRWHQYTSSFAVESYAYVPKNIDIGVLREMLHSFF